MSTVLTTYGYDNGHNRTSKSVSGGATTNYVIGNGNNGAGANQIVSETTSGVTTTYGYDLNGNRYYRIIPSSGGGSSSSGSRSGSRSSSGSGGGGGGSGSMSVYQYDDENRLVQLSVTGSGSGTQMYSYAYDYRTRRVQRTELGTVTNIAFDGGTSILEYASAASSPTVEYVRGHDYGGGVGGLEYSLRSSVAHFNFYDSRGDVTTQMLFSTLRS